jgi:stage III sporulation protein SpoIIIAA
LEKVLDWLRHLGEADESTITLLPLTPRYDAEKHGVYLYALEHALISRQEPVLNVALTGSYGVGKSSILEELARRHSRKVTAISLSTLGFPDEADKQTSAGAESPTKTNRIQKEIVSNCSIARIRSRCRVHGTAG